MNAFFKFVLKGSAVSALALMTAAVGCSDSDKDTPGTAGSGGTNAGGAPSNQGGDDTKAGSTSKGGDSTTPGGADAGGTDAGGTDAGGAGGGSDRPDIVFGNAGGEGGAGGAGDGPAVAKFCNSLTFGSEDDQQDTTMILEIGEGNDIVTLTAVSGTCAPMDAEACASIPLGDEVPVTMYDADDPTTPLDSGTIKSRAGASWIFYTDLTPDASPSPIFNGASFVSPACEDIIFDDVFGP